MITGVLSDEIDDGNLCPTSVVKICKAVPEAWTEMQEGACRLFGHARITVSRSGDDAFKEAEYATYFWYPVKCSNKVNFRGAWICKTRFNPTGHQGTNETCCAFHSFR